jgi:hypothetical protein
MIHRLDQPPHHGIPLSRGEVPRQLRIAEYCARAEARGFRVVQHRAALYLVPIH